MRVQFQTNIKKSQIHNAGDGRWLIKHIPMTVDNTVMNSIFYAKEDNALGLNSYIGKPIALSHPDGAQSAQTGRGLLETFGGGIVVNAYNENGINYADAEFKESLLLGQDGGELYLNKMKNGEPIGVSTGLYYDDNNHGGVTSNGIKYHCKAINQRADHLALLPDHQKPAGGDATVIRFNAEDDEQVMVINIDQVIKNELDTDVISKLKAWCKRSFAPNKEMDNNDLSVNENQTDEGEIMKREDLELVLNEHSIAFNSDDSDATLLSKLMTGKASTTNSEADQKIADLTEQVESLTAKVAANADAELDDLAKKASKFMGVDAETAKKLGTNGLHKVLAANGVVVSAPGAIPAANSLDGDKSKLAINMTPWEGSDNG